MKNKIVIFLIIILLGIGGIYLYNKYYLPIKNDPGLQTSDTLNLVSFLKQNNFQGAVVEQIYKPNNADIWLVKSDGQKILLYKKDLGTYADIINQPRYSIDIESGSSENVSLLPDYSEVYDHTLNKSWDISNYIVGYKPDPFWSTDVARGEVWANSPYYAGSLSPDGKHDISYPPPSQNVELNEVQFTNSQFSDNPVATFPNSRNSSFISWSVDGNYVLLRQTGGVTTGLEIYDIKNQKMTNIKESLNTQIPNGNSFISFIYPSEVIYSKNNVNGMGGTFVVNFAGQNQVEQMILPNDIKMIGFIPQ